MGVRGPAGCALGVLALLAAAALAPAASADMDVYASAPTLRTLNVEASATVPAAVAGLWRASVDADGSGAISLEETSIVVSVLDGLVMDPNATDVDAYTLAWARENETGAAGITVDGRANLADFLSKQASGLRWGASWDGANGTLLRAATTFTGLTGPVRANTSMDFLLEVVYEFPALDRNEPVHRLSLALPAGLTVALTVGGALELVETEHLDTPRTDASKSAVNGTTTSSSPVFLVKERAVSNGAFYLVLIAVVAPAALVALVAVYALPRMRVPDPGLIVEPKYK